jgi:putative protease
MLIQRKIPELLAPAGDRAGMVTAVDAGADAVYFGVKGMTMRHHAGNFELNELPDLMTYLHDRGKRGYLALNTIVYDRELDKVRRILRAAADAKVDAVIAWDLAVLTLAKEAGLAVHLSTQASCSNSKSATAFALLGVSRIVLARECTLEDIAQVREALDRAGSGVELEVFVHGAMCVSVSGRCFLSELSFDKSANRGECIQPCRREYKIISSDGEAEYELGSDYVLSPKDLCTMPFLDAVIETGAASLKIEGRMRSPEYARTTVSCYRRALDAYAAGALTDAMKADLVAELSTVYNRGFSDGFYRGEPEKWRSYALEHGYEKQMVGIVSKFFAKVSVAEVPVTAYGIAEGEALLFMGPRTPALRVDAYTMQVGGSEVRSAGKGVTVGIKVPSAVRAGDKVFVWRKKA